MFKRVSAKLGNMRKPQDFIVQLSDKGNFIVQSDKSIGKFDMNTGKGVLNTKGTTFAHLYALGAMPYEFPADFVQQCHQTFALKGDKIGSSAITGVVYYGGMKEISSKPAIVPAYDADNDYNWGEDHNVYPFDTVTYEPDYTAPSMRYTVYLYHLPRSNSVLDQYLLTADNHILHFADIEAAHQAARAAVQPEGRYLILGNDLMIGGQRYSEEFAVKDMDPDAYEAAVLERLCYKLPYSEKHLVSGQGEMAIPIHATRDEAWIVANYIACQCGYGARKVGENQLRLSVDYYRYLATYDNAVQRLVSVKRVIEE